MCVLLKWRFLAQCRRKKHILRKLPFKISSLVIEKSIDTGTVLEKKHLTVYFGILSTSLKGLPYVSETKGIVLCLCVNVDY